METKLALTGISKRFGHKVVLQDFSASFPIGETTCMLGPSGCGKTTLLRIMAGLGIPDSGSISGLDGQRVSFVFQEDRLLPWKTVSDNIRLVLKHTMERDAVDRAVLRHLDLVRMTEYASHYPHQLSGGMRRRVAFARAFSYPSDIILLDEPLKGLDVSLKKHLMVNVAGILSRDQRTAIYVTHDPEEAAFFGSTILIMGGRPAQVLHTIPGDTERHRRGNNGELVRKLYALLREMP